MSGRRMGHKEVKGPRFPSFANQNTGERIVKTWIPGAQSRRQFVRNLARKAKPILDSKDPETCQLGAHILQVVGEYPDPQHAALVLICAAIDAVDQTGESFITCATYLLEKIEVDRAVRLAEAGKLKATPIATASTHVHIEEPLSPPTERTA